MTYALAFQTPADATPWQRRLQYSPLARVIFFLAVIALIGFVLSLAMGALGWTRRGAPPEFRITAQLLQYLVSSVAGYLVVAHMFEHRRWPGELVRRRWLPELGIGLAAGAGYITTVVALLWIAGAYTVTGFRADVPIATSLLIAGVGASVFEEIVFRGVLFRIVEEGLGTWAALVVSALFFGFVHIFNPGATVWSSVAIAIEAGLLLGMVYHVTRSLPLCIGMHAAWNFTQGTVYGSPVSGLPNQGSWLVAQVSGPDWLTGGSFGFEASVAAVAVGLAATAALIVGAIRRGTIVPWRPARAAPAYHGIEAKAT